MRGDTTTAGPPHAQQRPGFPSPCCIHVAKASYSSLACVTPHLGCVWDTQMQTRTLAHAHLFSVPRAQIAFWGKGVKITSCSGDMSAHSHPLERGVQWGLGPGADPALRGRRGVSWVKLLPGWRGLSLPCPLSDDGGGAQARERPVQAASWRGL